MMFNPPHPGTVLRDYLGETQVVDAAKHLGVSRVTLSRVLNGSASISADMAIRLSEALEPVPTCGPGCKASMICGRQRRNAGKKWDGLLSLHDSFQY